MSNEPIRNHDVGAHGSFEHEDLSPRAIIYFLLALIVSLGVLYVIVFEMYRVLDSYNHANQATMSPMVAPEADTRTVTDADTKAFPEPRLEKSERTELRDFIENQDRTLATYNWVDKDKGIVQIPIDRAMDLIVQRGLPVRSQEKGQEQPRKEGSSAQ
ncbi:MAG: hypothetical protein WA609_05260 [Terriglobales bacterium]